MTVISGSARGVVVLFAALALGLAGCAAAGPAAPAALDFVGTTLDGSTLDAGTLAGTPVALWFWAPWCTICRAEAPDVAAVAAEFEGRVRVLGVPGRGDVAEMRGFVADTGTGAITHVVDPDGSLWNRFGVVTQPAFVFVDRDGGARSFAGALGAEQLREFLTELA
jgi:thiol-disulfide isomerase/thioredoxin